MYSPSDYGIERRAYFSAVQAQGYSPLERAAYTHQHLLQPEAGKSPEIIYFRQGAYRKVSYEAEKRVTTTYIHNPWLFLKPVRPEARFIGDALEIREMVEETFRLTTGKDLPEDVSITLCSKEELAMLHNLFGGFWREGVLGFAVNGKGVFVMKNNLDVLMLTLGHELGHVFTPMLKNPVKEEAKAFAFEIAWMKAIQEHNIGNLAGSIETGILSPANNGIHDVAFNFVRGLLKENKSALEVYWEIAAGFENLSNFP